VRPLVVTAVSRTTMLPGQSSTLSALVMPARPGTGISVQRYFSGRWHTVATTSLTSRARATWTFKPWRPGTFTYRFYRPADPDYAAGSSRLVRLTVG